MSIESRLTAIMRAYIQDPEIATPAEEFAAEVSDEIHDLAHQYLAALPSLQSACEPLTDLFLGMLKMGIAHGLLLSRPPAEEREASGPILPDEQLKKLLGDDLGKLVDDADV